MIIYGSFAIRHWFPDFPRDPKDIDVVLLEEKTNKDKFFQKLLKNDLPIEINVAPFFECVADLTEDNFLTPEGLLTVKMSHAMYNESWNKTISDIIFLQNKGVQYDLEKLNILRENWKHVHAGKRAKMNFKLPPEEFFNSNVKRILPHDIIHERLKLDVTPAYKKILKNDTTVEVSKEKFDKLSYEEQLCTALEECLVLACERYYHLQSPKMAYLQALHDFVTRMSSGWFNIFVLENIKFYTTFNNPIIWKKVNQIMEELNLADK